MGPRSYYIAGRTVGVDAPITAQNVVVVFSPTNIGNVALPTAARQVGFAGVTTEPSSAAGNVEITYAGVEMIQTDGSGTITYGKEVEIANTQGQIRQVATAVPQSPVSGTLYETGIVGIAMDSAAATPGLLIPVWLTPQVRSSN